MSSIDLTNPPVDFIKSELEKCAKDPIYFLKNYGRIRTEKEGIVKFDLFDYQAEIIDTLLNERFIAVLKSRQLGVTTVVSGFIAWLMLFRRQRNIYIVATKRNKAQISFAMVKTFVLECPKWMRLFDIVTNNQSVFSLSNGSKVEAHATSPDVGRGEAASLFFIDEAAIIDKLSEHWSGLYPTIVTGGRCIMASTPKGVGNKFWEICIKGSNKLEDGTWSQGENEFKVLRYPWHRRFSKEWFLKETTSTNMTRREIAQEYECAFIGSGDTFLDPELIEKVQKSIKEPIRREQRDVWIWSDPIPTSRYILSADVAKGDGSDNSTFHIIDIENASVAVEYSGKLKTEEFANLIIHYGLKYNNALAVPESNTYGDAVIQTLLRLDYPNVYYSVNGGFVTMYDAASMSRAKPGHATTLKTRPLILMNLEDYIKKDKIKLNSKRLYDEFLTFIWKNGRPESLRGNTDDLIMSIAIGLYTMDKVYGTYQRINKKEDLLAAGFGVSKTSFGEAYTPGKTNKDMSVNKQLEDFMTMMIRRR